jgi:energy-coupling factor transporter transmembrane protein EcfT
VSSCIFTSLYRLWVLVLICFVLVFILSFDACIVIITWFHLFLVIALWVMCLTRWITLAILSSSDLLALVCFLVFRWLARKHLVMLTDMVSSCITFNEAPHLAQSVVRTGVTVLLRLCNPPRRGDPAKSALLNETPTKSNNVWYVYPCSIL